MKQNVGSADKIIRILLAIVFMTLFMTDTVTGTPGLVLVTLAVVFVLTSLVGFCPIYRIIGVSTCPAKKA
ncbi:MAG: DUF2892 domain-containing protein [Flavipsychrobacter sp.]|nr:DUF2892 domain-containing protein [Flavipsychrobacter sp.]